MMRTAPRLLGLATAVLLWVLLWPASAHSDALHDHLGPREIALGDSLRASAHGALSINLNPAGLGLTREMAFEGSYGYRFADSASALTLSACDSTVTAPGCFYYRYMGASPELGGVETPHRAHEGGVVAAYGFGQSVIIGTNFKYFDYNTSVLGDEDASGFTFDAGLVVRPLELLTVGFTGHHLLGKRSTQYPRALSAGMMVRPIPQLGISFDAIWRLEREDGTSTGRYGGGIEYFLSSPSRRSGFPIRLGAAYDVATSGTYIGGGTGFASDKIGLDIGVRRQVDGGDETVIQASLRFFGPRQVPGTGTYL